MDTKQLIELAEIVSNYKDAIVIRTPQAVEIAEGYLQLVKEHAVMREALENIQKVGYSMPGGSMNRTLNAIDEIAQKVLKEVSGE